MDAGKIRLLLAAPLAALFLILLLATFATRQRGAQGVPLRVYAIQPDTNARAEGCNSRRLVVWLDAEGAVRINETETPLDKLRSHLTEIFENRSVKQVFVVADSSVSYQQFVEFYSRIDGASPGLEVMLFSGDFRRAQERRAVVPCVFLPGMVKIIPNGS
jgi:biopolymer transport protein ExbD